MHLSWLLAKEKKRIITRKNNKKEITIARSTETAHQAMRSAPVCVDDAEQLRPLFFRDLVPNALQRSSQLLLTNLLVTCSKHSAKFVVPVAAMPDPSSNAL